MDSAASEIYQQVKLVLIDGSRLSKDALHVYGGMAIYLGMRLIVPQRRWVAWAVVLIAALTGEWLDMQGEHLRGDLQPDTAHWHDIWNTLFWPTILMLLERWWPQPPAPDTASGENAERGLEQA